MNYPDNLKPRDIIYDLIVDKPGITPYHIVDMVEVGSPLKQFSEINKGLKILQEEDLIVGKKTVTTRYGEVYVTREFYPVKGLLDILKVKGRNIGRKFISSIEGKLLGKTGDRYRVPIKKTFGPDHFNIELAKFTLERQEYEEGQRESGWKIDYSHYNKKRPIRSIKGIRSYSTDVDIELEVCNQRYSRNKLYYTGDKDEVEISAIFTKPLGEKETTIPDEVWRRYAKKVARSIIPTIHTRTQKLVLDANRILFKSGSKKTAMKVLDELENINNGKKPKEFLDIIEPIRADSLFSDLNPNRKDDKERYREFVSYLRNRINLTEI